MEWWTILGLTVTTASIHRLSDAFTISWYCEIIFKFDYRMDIRKQNTVIL